MKQVPPSDDATDESANSPTPTRMVDGREVLDLDRYVPYFFAAINNALSATASTVYRADFGIGVTDWRVLSTLAQEPDIAASRIVALVALDKAAVSRSLSALAELGIAQAKPGKRDPRRKAWRLTAKGWRLHDAVLARALERERALIHGIDPEDMAACLRAMRRMRANVENLADAH
jgi:DNA-binding MarR family transcriptional regulator